MASISTAPDGNLTIQFLLDGKRRTVWLGKMKPEAADKIKTNLQFIIEDKEQGEAHSAELVKWIRGLGDKMHGKLAKKGLFPARASAKQTTLLAWIDRCIEKRTDVKPATKEIWRQGKKGLIDFYGADRPLTAITGGEADDYKLKLIADKLAPYTVSKRLQFANKVFISAVDHELLLKNPFSKVKIKKTMKDRKRFISAEDTRKLIDSCPDQDWRLIVSLARWGGLRCPSEVLSVTWADIDWDRSRVRVTSPKTEHHVGKDHRELPLFPELRAELQAAWTPESAGYIVDERFRKGSMGPAGWRNCNLRTTFQKIVKRAGLTPWPRLFHNLRSSRQTELQEKFPMHVVCAWLGNSPDIAREHYLQTTDEHFELAAPPTDYLQKPVQYQAVSGEIPPCPVPANVGFTAGFLPDTTLYNCPDGEDGIRTHGGL
jgi:integrase